jgi:hypothetical protein
VRETDKMSHNVSLSASNSEKGARLCSVVVYFYRDDKNAILYCVYNNADHIMTDGKNKTVELIFKSALNVFANESLI